MPDATGYQPIPRLKLPVYAYELVAGDNGDLLVTGQLRVTGRSPEDVDLAELEDDDTIDLRFADGSTRTVPARRILDVYRDRALVPGFENAEPAITA